MARRTTKKTGGRWRVPRPDVEKFENIHQIGGIRVATLDQPGLGGGPANGSRVAMVNTGGGLRFTVALDRGGDIVEASYNQHSLTYLSPNGYKRASHAYHRDNDWLASWPAGLITSCGPGYIGHGREEDGQKVNLHGHHSNTPTELEMLLNPDPHMGRFEMLLSMVIRDATMFGPHLEVRRQIQCHLGMNHLAIYDQVTNRGNQTVAHNWLYHCNFGYPLLDEGTRFIYKGAASHWQMPTPPAKPPTVAEMNALKTATGPLKSHNGWGEHGLIVDPPADKKGNVHVGLLNEKLGLGVELRYPKADLPRMANWQHFGERGSYVTALEPFYGSLFGKAGDTYPGADSFLKPGESRRYQLSLRLNATPESIARLKKYDGRVTKAK